MNNNRTIYLVDDDQDDRFLLKEAILGIDKNLTIIEVENGINLLQLIAKNTLPNLILLDMNMPGLDGLEILKMIRSNPDLSATPAVMISTASNTELIQEAYHNGISHFFPKPSTFEGFRDIARHLTKNYLS